MSAMIDFLPAEIPNAERATRPWNRCFDQLDAMSAVGFALEFQAAQAIADLGLSNAAVAQNDQFDRIKWLRFVPKISEMRADPGGAIFVRVCTEYFIRHAANAGVTRSEFSKIVSE